MHHIIISANTCPSVKMPKKHSCLDRLISLTQFPTGQPYPVSCTRPQNSFETKRNANIQLRALYTIIKEKYLLISENEKLHDDHEDEKQYGRCVSMHINENWEHCIDDSTVTTAELVLTE